MSIYVVKPGDSIWSIANRFGVSAQRIIQVNELTDIPYLIVGQALVIPSTETAYRVQPGDTLWSISMKFRVPVQSIVKLNNIANPSMIYPGRVLRIPELSKNFGFIEVNAYIEPSTEENEKRIINDVGQYLTYISPFSYQVKVDGGITAINDTAILTASKPFNIAPLLVITNFKAGNFDTELVDTILKSEEIQRTLIDNIVNIMKSKGYRGLNIDFERISPQNRSLYNDFLRRVVAVLRPLGYFVSTALAPKSEDIKIGAWHGAHDYKAHGEIVDFVIIMTYEWGWSGGPPYAVAPINLVREVLEYAMSVMPPKKIIMGLPLYGYDWTLPYVPGGKWARRVDPQQALRIAAQYGAQIQYDYKVQSPYFNYRDSAGKEHVIWFEDARSIRAKLMLPNEYGLRGVSYWVLGLDFPQNWYILNDMYNIVKVV